MGFHPPVFMRIFNLKKKKETWVEMQKLRKKNKKISKYRKQIFAICRGGKVDLPIKTKCNKVQQKQTW